MRGDYTERWVNERDFLPAGSASANEPARHRALYARCPPCVGTVVAMTTHAPQPRPNLSTMTPAATQGARLADSILVHHRARRALHHAPVTVGGKPLVVIEGSRFQLVPDTAGGGMYVIAPVLAWGTEIISDRVSHLPNWARSYASELPAGYSWAKPATLERFAAASDQAEAAVAGAMRPRWLRSGHPGVEA